MGLLDGRDFECGMQKGKRMVYTSSHIVCDCVVSSALYVGEAWGRPHPLSGWTLNGVLTISTKRGTILVTNVKIRKCLMARRYTYIARRQIGEQAWFPASLLIAS